MSSRNMNASKTRKPTEAKNHRNGASAKTVLTEGIEMLRDRSGNFEPLLIPMHERSQFVTSSSGTGYGGRRYAPYAFTEQGLTILSSVVNTPRDAARCVQSQYESATQTGV
jgi:hypothetical protein